MYINFISEEQNDQYLIKISQYVVGFQIYQNGWKKLNVIMYTKREIDGDKEKRWNKLLRQQKKQRG
jgi:hypothetical protein